MESSTLTHPPPKPLPCFQSIHPMPLHASSAQMHLVEKSLKWNDIPTINLLREFTLIQQRVLLAKRYEKVWRCTNESNSYYFSLATYETMEELDTLHPGFSMEFKEHVLTK